MNNNELPFGTQFSPNVVDLRTVLKLINRYEGEETTVFINALADTFFSNVAKNSQRDMASNCKNSLVAYGLLNSGGGINISEFGKYLLTKIEDKQLYDAFAQHILKNLNGLALIDCIRTLTRQGSKVTNESIITALNERGFNYAKTANNPQVMKLWLTMAGILIGWRVNEARLSELVDISENELLLFKTLSKEQYYYIKTMCNIGTDEFQKASAVRELAKSVYGISFGEKAFASNVLNPLESKGLIELRRATEGRGAKSHDIKLTEFAKKEIIIPFLQQIEGVIGNDILQHYQKPLQEIRKDMDSYDTYIKGLALEALAIKIMHIIGLDFVETRLKGTETSGAEVDVLFESSKLLYSRWQVQCKNSSKVSVDHVAKEVGLHHLLKSNAIVIMTTGTVSEVAREYANGIMKTLNICIIFVEGSDIDLIISNPLSIVDVFNREALAAKHIKVFDVQSVTD
ncbi:MAG: restriction endonuclease [Oscillospiraceae bacterium]|nr:restriction endonuclease [Oscillospiraceae bacterium]